jgi:hypothetical protein
MSYRSARRSRGGVAVSKGTCRIAPGKSAVGLLLSLISSSLLLTAAGCGGTPPDDEEMIRYFHEHGCQFVELLDGYSAGDLQELGIVEGGPAIWSGYPDAQAFVTSYRRWMGESWWKGYVYSAQPLIPLVESIDEDAVGLVYRYLGNGWYLFYRNEQ